MVALALFQAPALPRQPAGEAASPRAGMPEVELSPSVRRLLDSPALDPAEARLRRIFHGVWRASDLDSPGSVAIAALQRGVFDHPDFDAPDADVLDRADAFCRRGEAEQALTLLDGVPGLRARRIRAEAHFDLGRFAEARAELDAVGAMLAARTEQSASELTEGIRALILRQRMLDPGDAQGRVVSDYNVLASLIARVRDDIDRLHWPVLIVEAELLYDKDNYAQAQEAVIEALRLNPGAARAWALLGEMAVDAFDMDRASAIADRLDMLAESVGGVSIDASLIRARSRLRQGDGQGAEDVLAPMVERAPRHRRLLGMHAAAAAARFDFAGAEDRLADFGRLAGPNPTAHLTVGIALSEARQYAEAAIALGRAAEALPTWARPWIELGLLELQAGNDINAKDALAQAYRLDPFNVRVDNSLRLITELAAYERIESEHFIVRYRPGIDAVLAREMLPVLERIHARVCGDGPGGIRHVPPRKTLIELMPDHHWFSVRITGMPRVHTMAAATGPVIAMETPREGHGHVVGPYDWERVIRHEYAHTVTLSRTLNRIPHWFTEAAAVYVEDAPRAPEWVGLLSEALLSDQLFDLERINIAFVRPRRPSDRTQAYAQGHWMYEFIIENWGAQAPLRLMDRYAAGEREARAFADVLGVTSEEFMSLFSQWAFEQVATWGVHLPEELPELRLLLAEMYAQPDAPPAPTPEIAEEWLTNFPNHPQVLDLAARLAKERAGGRVDETAAAYLERLAVVRPHDPAPRRELVRFYLRSETPQRAVDHLEWLDEREQHTPAFAAELARQYAAIDDWGRAHAKAERATRIAPFDANERETAAAMAIKAERFADARRHIEALIVIEPDRVRHRQRLEALDRLIAGRSSSPDAGAR